MTTRDAFLSRTDRIVIALLIGVASGVVTASLYDIAPGGDFFQIWAAARVLREGLDPYAMVGPGLTYDWDWPFYYPVPAFILAIPLSWFSPALAGSIFFGLSNAVLAHALMGRHSYRLLMFVSTAWIEAAVYCQWSPLLTAAFLMPSLGWVFAAKPNIGLALFAARPSRVATAGVLVIVSLSILLQPAWPGEWLMSIRDAPHIRAPIMSWPGALLALAALRWRRWEGRLLFALACVPQTPHLADTLPLFLIPATLLEMAVLVSASYVQVLWVKILPIPTTYDQAFATAAPLITALIYLPCLIMVLRRPNEGDVPAWFGHLVKRVRAFLPPLESR